MGHSMSTSPRMTLRDLVIVVVVLVIAATVYAVTAWIRGRRDRTADAPRVDASDLTPRRRITPDGRHDT